MKNHFFLVLIIIFLSVSCSINTSMDLENTLDLTEQQSSQVFHAKSKSHKPLKIFKAASDIIVDGLDDEWDDVPPRKMREELDLGIPIENKSDLSSSVRMLWDETNLYIFASIIDEEINVSGAQLFEKDGFEVYIDGDNSKNEAAPGFPAVFPPPAYDSNDDFVRFIPGESIAFGAWGIIDFTSVEFAFISTQSGYDLEISMPFVDLPDFNGEAGHEFGFEFQLNDNDNGQRQNALKQFSSLDQSFYNPSLFGTGVLFKSIAE